MKSVRLVVKRFSRRRDDLAQGGAAWRAHRKTLALVRQVLRKRGIAFRQTQRINAGVLGPAEWVISVGGDGTFLEAARAVRRQSILGVNSNPRRSVGSFCAADARTFEAILQRLERGKARSIFLTRMQLRRNGRPAGSPVLNDLLITHRKPAAMSHYWIRIGRQREEQRSSGLWISTAAGSTGAIRSAGGRALPWSSRRLLYRPRELCLGGRSSYRLRGGSVPPGRRIRMGSLMSEGMVCADGEHVTYPFRYGDRLEIGPSRFPLRIIHD